MMGGMGMPGMDVPPNVVDGEAREVPPAAPVAEQAPPQNTQEAKPANE